MNQQLGLFDRRIVTINAHGMTLDQQFEAFHQANPHVYHQLRALALDAAHRPARSADAGTARLIQNRGLGTSPATAECLTALAALFGFTG